MSEKQPVRQTVRLGQDVGNRFGVEPMRLQMGTALKALIPAGAGLLGACAPILPATGAEITQPATTPETNLGTPVLPTPTPAPKEVALAQSAEQILPSTDQYSTYAKAMGLTVEQVAARVEVRTLANGASLLIDTEADVPVMIGNVQGSGELTWSPANPRVLSGLTGKGKEYGVSVDGSEGWRTKEYKQRALEWGLIMPDGSFFPNTLNDYGDGMGKSFLSWAREAGARARILSVFHTQADFAASGLDVSHCATQAEVDAYMQMRLEQLINPGLIKKGSRTQVVLAHENTIQTYGGGVHWYGEGADNGLERNPLFDIYGTDWPSVAAVHAVRVAQEQGLVLGEDFTLAVSNYDLLQNDAKTNATAGMLGSMRSAVAEYLGIPVEAVKIDVLDQLHLHNDQANARGWDGVWVPQIDTGWMRANMNKLANAGGGKVHLSEVDISWGPQGTLPDAGVQGDTYAKLVGLCEETETCGGVDWYQPFRRGDADGPGIYDPSTRGKMGPQQPYYSILGAIWRSSLKGQTAG